jgi:hypothetical protein
MGTTEQHFNLVRISNSSWVAVHVNQGSGDGKVYTREPESSILRNGTPHAGRMFSQTAAARTSFTERFPRLTIAMISFALFAVTATAEVEWLRHAGYVWN